MPHWGKIIGEHEVVGGFLGAALVVGGFLAWNYLGLLWFITAPFLIVLGLLLLIDDVYPYGRQPYLMSESGGFIAGCILTVVSVFYGVVGWVLSTAFFLSVIKLLVKVLKKI